ncbi:zinc-binding dehydrogenase [Candidatus Pelagibacter sp.]|jgi:S-(hydroxymethyl)glutathione dehydrogenase / alcohol dehydrogenase|nr:zinc-binding dehydrogenase [Candidatus Pelagibacter sp.]
MKAAILVESNKPLVVGDIDIPSSLEFGQVLVKVHYSGICGAQINEIEALKGPDKFLPHLLGHEGSGFVEKIGNGVKNVKPGDKVVLHWRPSQGIQSETASYLWNGKKINSGWVTTFNEKAVVSENRLTKIPDDFDMRIAALFGCAVTSGFGAVNNDAQVKIGQSVLIFGIGGMGLNIAYAASLVSAYPIIGVDLYQEKIDMGKQFGLTHGIMADSTNFNKHLKEILKNKEPEIVFETTGNSKVMEKSFEITPKDGKTIFVGVPNDKISIYSLPLAFNKTLKVSHGGDSKPDQDIPRYINLIKNKKMNLDKLITHEFHLENINEAIDLFRTGQAGRILINNQKEK